MWSIDDEDDNNDQNNDLQSDDQQPHDDDEAADSNTDGDRLTTKFYCKECDITCSRESEWSRHIGTRKHVARFNSANDGTAGGAAVAATEGVAHDWSCSTCAKTYLTKAGLWKHQKTCEEKKDGGKVVQFLMRDNHELKAMMIEMMKSNHELHIQMLELCKQSSSTSAVAHMAAGSGTTITANHTNTNSHNKTFNMQVFLNEHCKDAMNLSEFVDSIQLNLDDLESVGKAGFVEGIANIIVGKLRATDVHMRPIHCSDAKREVMYIKENNKWAKEGPNNENMRKFVQFIERKNIKLLGEYQQKYPESQDYESPRNDHYLHLSLTATCATQEHLDKVISRIAKEVLIDK
jgi:hypothetical protein